MATSFNLQEYMLFRTEIKRELTNAEVDTNFQMVANPWEAARLYQVGNIIYHPVVVDDPDTTGEDQLLGWWRANKTTTQGVFDLTQWDIVGGIGTSTINVLASNGFGRINVNSTTAPGALQNGNDAVVTSTTPNDLFNFIAGDGVQLQYNLASKSIKIINTIATDPGEANVGENVGLGAGHQDVYAGKVGVNLQFNGFQSTNTSNAAGNALTISTNVAQKNIEYNFDEGNVDLAALNSGATTISMISDISGAVPNANDVLQWNIASNLWTPVSLAALGQVNIYNNNGSIGAANRIVTLNATAGALQFNSAGNAGSGLNIPNINTAHQLETKQANINQSSAILHSTGGVTRATAGFTPIGTIASWGVRIDNILGGVATDAFSIDTQGAIYVPQLENDATLTGAGVTHRIPLISTVAAESGKFRSSSNLKAVTYTSIDGATGQIDLQLTGQLEQTATSDGLQVFNAQKLTTDAKFGGASATVVASNVATTYKCNGVNQIFTYDAFQFSSNVSKLLVGGSITTSGLDSAEIEKIIGYRIDISNRPSVIGNGLTIGLGQCIEFSDISPAVANPQRVGLFANVIDNSTGIAGTGALLALETDGGTWSGFFVGNVNISKGALVLPSVAANPASAATAARGLWINSANGHLYRGNVDVEAGGGGGAFLPLAGGTMTGNIGGNPLTTSIGNFQRIEGAQIISQLTALAPVGTVVTWDTVNGTTVPLDLSAESITVSGFAINNLGSGGTATLFFTGGANSAIQTNAWTADGNAIKWPGGIAPSTSVNGNVDIITFKSDGQNVYGTAILNYA